MGKVQKNKKLRRVGTVVSLCALLCMGNMQAEAKNLTNQDVLDARRGVVRVIYDDGEWFYMGSAFGVGTAGEETDLFVTCYHVVNPNYDDNETYETVFIATGESIDDDTYEVEVLYADSLTDIAILRAERKVEDRIALPMIASSNIEATTPVYTLGYPGIGDEYSDKTYYGGDFSSLVEDQMITTGIVTKSKITMEGVNYFMIDADINHGNSGGPAVTAQGYVVGVNEAIAADSDGGNYVGYVTHADYVMQALDNLHLSYDEVSASQYEHDMEEQDALPAVTEEVPEPESGPDLYVVLLALAIGVVFVILMGFIIYMVHRDKKREAQIAREREQYMARSRIEAYQNAMAVRGAPKIIGMQGIFANNSFTVTGCMVMGRSRARCHLLFPENTPGVSKVHCELRIVNGGLYLMDRGSSYGTFVGNGMRLTPGQPYQLRDGEIFYLAAPQHSFIVRM